MSEIPRASINCTGVFLAECSMRIKDGANTEKLNGEYQLEYEFSIQRPSEGELFAIVGVKCIHKVYPEILEARFKAAGHFTGDTESLTRFEGNCFGVVLPYLRTYVSTITSMGPMNPLMIPMLNVSRKALEQLSAPPASSAEANATPSTSTTPPP